MVHLALHQSIISFYEMQWFSFQKIIVIHFRKGIKRTEREDKTIGGKRTESKKGKLQNSTVVIIAEVSCFNLTRTNYLDVLWFMAN
jgi:hypothetical protein